MLNFLFFSRAGTQLLQLLCSSILSVLPPRQLNLQRRRSVSIRGELIVNIGVVRAHVACECESKWRREERERGPALRKKGGRGWTTALTYLVEWFHEEVLVEPFHQDFGVVESGGRARMWWRVFARDKLMQEGSCGETC